MELEKVKIADLKPLERNVRRHNDKQIDEFIKSIDANGQTRAFVIDEDNNILIGNGMYFAMKKMGMAEADALRKVGLSEKDKKKLILSDNKIFSLGVDNFEEVNNFINEIAAEGDYSIAGFDEEIIKRMTAELEQVETEIKSYGIVEQKPVEKVEVRYTAPTTSAPSEDYVTPAPAPTQKVEFSAPQVERKVVICPSCGEVIEID